MSSRKLRRFLDGLYASGAVSAAAALVGSSRSIEYRAAVGVKRRRGAGRVTTSSLFDLASLTKPVTATLALALDRRGDLSLSTTVGGALGREGIAVESSLGRRRLGTLLRHRSGLRPWTPLFDRCRARSEVVELLSSSPGLLSAGPQAYSDLGFILWGGIAEATTGRSLGALMQEHVARPLGLHGLVGPPGDVPTVVECRLGNERERDLARAEGLEIAGRGSPPPGTAQDGNARFLGGPSGHAGLFGSARAIWRLAAEWLAPGAVLTEAAVESALAGRGEFVLGWWRRPAESAGRAGLWYGHRGFTGGGVWFCPETDEIRVFLAHRSSVSVPLNQWHERFLELKP